MSFDIQGLPPFFTSNKDFYRIDTSLSVPDIDVDAWRLRVMGMVDRPLELSFGDVLALPQTEAAVTLCCVSNKVGDKLVGTARWRGVDWPRSLPRQAGNRVGHKWWGGPWTAGPRAFPPMSP